MQPPSKAKTDFERLEVDTWINGIIEEVKLDKERKKIYKGKESVREAVRLKFKFDGYEFPHYSRWYTYNYGEKSNLYLKVLLPLVENAAPDMEFDMDALVKMPIKTMWVNNGEFQNLEMIRPLKAQIPHTAKAPEPPAGERPDEDDDSIPF